MFVIHDGFETAGPTCEMAFRWSIPDTFSFFGRLPKAAARNPDAPQNLEMFSEWKTPSFAEGFPAKTIGEKILWQHGNDPDDLRRPR
jgi:hypothetical protein